MTQPEDAKTQYMRGQLERLGYFLVASSFLVAVFVQLVVADTNNTLANVRKLLLLVHAIAILGMFIAVLYAFMNFWLWRKRRLQVVHTFVIPGLFLLFWLAAWYIVTHEWFAFPIVGGFVLVCFIYQRYRDSKIERRS
jgi:hypothetical protein